MQNLSTLIFHHLSPFPAFYKSVAGPSSSVALGGKADLSKLHSTVRFTSTRPSGKIATTPVNAASHRFFVCALTFAANRARLRCLTEVHRSTRVGLGRAVRQHGRGPIS